MADVEGYTLIVGLGATGLSCVRHLALCGETPAVADSRAAPPGLGALRAEFPGIDPVLGAFDTEQFAKAGRVVLSPGVSPDEPAVRFARERGIPVLGDIELFAREVTVPVAAVTGSNGKSTVTCLVGDMARRDDLKVRVGGNLGPPALSLLQGDAPDLFVLELSSFQLETTESLDAAAATVLNVSADHMDRYRDLAHYAAAKRRIFRGSGVMVLNLDDPVVAEMADRNRERIGFTLAAPDGDDFGVIERAGEKWLARGSEPLVAQASLPLPGLHNVANCLAAIAMGEALNVSMGARLQALAEFRGLPHRCQLVAEAGGVRWYNDSKGTNVGATVAAIAGLGADRPLVLIAGGVGKDADFAPLKSPVSRHVRQVVLFGRDAQHIENALEGSVPCIRARDLDEAVRAAKRTARRGDAVLFSPACASFDMFDNYEARGRAFISAVNEVTGS